MTDDEGLKLRYQMFNEKHADDSKNINSIKTEGDTLVYEIANRIYNESFDEIFFNNCPKCNRLANTPFARQCRLCGHNWHDVNVAKFKLEAAFQMTNSHFFFIGKVIKGDLKVGQFVDLTFYGFNLRPEILSIEYALKKIDGVGFDDIALGTNEPSDSEKEYFKNLKPRFRTIDIIDRK